ncbi:MAG TPA: SGNH/GDSL hydrolase family protein [Gemmatimonadaceae bacterium]|nr:SGNH/GDSL hydrolase family protein [Gemmatimonadaceae bacterium]
MSRTHAVVRGALLLGAAGAMVACGNEPPVLGPAVVDPLFKSYVSIGNSITAGYQSGGINDSTQRLAYPVLLARQMGTRMAYPSLVMPGCPPPISNTLTGARVGVGSNAGTCGLPPRSGITANLNNVAVPGIATADPTMDVGPNANPLVELFLGGKTMVQKALDIQPTFATVWVGNNDILAPALGGLPAGATTVPTFISNYAKMITQLMAGAPALKGVLIGVVQVAQTPLMFQAGLIDASAAVRGAASQVAGRPVTLDPITCAGAAAGALVNFQYLPAIAARTPAQGGAIYCQKVAGGGTGDPGDNGILDVAEQATVTATINGYNAYIKAKADSIGFAYYDPNPTLAAFRTSGAIPPFPNLTTPTTLIFGQYFSLDGVHPSAAAHVVLANDLINVINTKFGTKLVALPTT